MAPFWGGPLPGSAHEVSTLSRATTRLPLVDIRNNTYPS